MKLRRYFPRLIKDQELQTLAAFYLATEPSTLLVDEPFYPLLMIGSNVLDIMKMERAFKHKHIANPLIVIDNCKKLKKLDPAPKIILIDINTTGINQFLEKIHHDPQLKSSKIFIVTGSDHQRDKITAYSLNIAGYIRRPINYDRLLKVISLIHPLQYQH